MKANDATAQVMQAAADQNAATNPPFDLKTAATAIKDAYEAVGGGKGKDKELAVSYQETGPGGLCFTVKGKTRPVDALLKMLQDRVITDVITVPDWLKIHITIVSAEDGPAAEKPEDQTRTLTIRHAITAH